MDEKILLSHDKKIYWCLPNEIWALQGDGSYTLISLSNGQVIRMSKNMKSVFATFPSTCTQFIRIQKSYIVNVNYIEYLHHQKNYKYLLHLYNGADLPINHNARKQLLELFGLTEKNLGRFSLQNKQSEQTILEAKLNLNRSSVDDFGRLDNSLISNKRVSKLAN